ncbi:MAG: hypothetical protein E7348_00955 [Clostridiales bacterium]|nr:hypothetical protein [Clostridiales bacterium]
MKLLKKVLTFGVATLMTFACTLGLTACSTANIQKLKLTVEVYDYANDDQVEYTMNIDLYGHLAEDTVNNIVSYVNDKYYDGTVFYKLKNYSNQIMIGDYKFENNSLVKNAEMPTVEGEFTYGGQKTEGGSPLSAKKGTIGLWRSWYAQDDSYTGRAGMESGSATWFIPTQAIDSYNDYFCIFAQYDLADDANNQTITALTNIFASADNYETYVVYYTGEYGNLTYHCVKSVDFDESEIEDLFEAEDDQYVSFNKTEIQVPVTPNGELAAKIVKAEMVK